MHAISHDFHACYIDPAMDHILLCMNIAILHSIPTPNDEEQWEPVRRQLVIVGSLPLQTYPNPRKTSILESEVNLYT